MSFETAPESPAENYFRSVKEIINNAKGSEEIKKLKEFFQLENEKGPEKFKESDVN